MVLQPMGPHYDLEVRRSQLPSEDMWKAASKKDKRCVDMHAILYIHVYTYYTTPRLWVMALWNQHQSMPHSSCICIYTCCRITPKKVKNIQRTSIGDKIGRIHMKPQNLDASVGKRISVLRNSGSKRSSDEAGREGASPKRVKKAVVEI